MKETHVVWLPECYLSRSLAMISLSDMKTAPLTCLRCNLALFQSWNISTTTYTDQQPEMIANVTANANAGNASISMVLTPVVVSDVRIDTMFVGGLLCFTPPSCVEVTG